MSVQRLANEGSKMVRDQMLPYGHQWIDQSDIAAVIEVLESDWLTTGPKVDEFEQAFADYVNTSEAVAVCNGTAALHAAMHAIGIGPSDEVIVPAMTFAATANCVVYQGGTPVFTDVKNDDLLIDPEQVEENITSKTKAIISVDYAGQPCDYEVLRDICTRNGLWLVADACHALGGSYKGRKVGSLADLSTFSFHPVKPITSGEGGMITVDDSMLARRMRVFRNHGITTDYREREKQDSWYYEMVDLGFNYRLTDIQCALGLSQLLKLPGWVADRQAIARKYDKAFSSIPAIKLMTSVPYISHAYHLYLVAVGNEQQPVSRASTYSSLRTEGIGVGVHYIPVHLHPFYRQNFNTRPGQCPVAEAVYERLLSLPIYPSMKDGDVDHVISAMLKVLEVYC